MRIGLFTDTYLPDINGVVNSVELLRKKLSEAGHEVFVVCPYKGLTVKREGNILRLPGVELKSLYGYTLTTPVHLLFAEDLKKLNLDIIHAETEFGVGLLANYVAYRFKLPLVRTYHTTYEDYTHYLNLLKLDMVDEQLKKVVAMFSKLFGNYCVKLIAPSNKTAELLLSYGVKNKPVVIPTGIELDRFKADFDKDKLKELRSTYAKEDERLLLFVGRIAKEKSLDKVIKAFKEVKKNKLKLKLLIVGGGPSFNELNKMVKEYDLVDTIFFTGKKDFNDVPEYYKIADGFISASTSETQGITYIEALASGLVLLAHYDKVLSSLLVEGENGYFFYDDVYEALKKFNDLSDDELAIIKSKAVSYAEPYDAKHFLENTLKLYEEAIEEYRDAYIINKIALNDSAVKLYLKAYDKENTSLYLSLDTYSRYSFRLGDRLLNETYLTLRKEEYLVLAYNKAIKRIANKDYSVKEMRDYLFVKCMLTDKDIDIIIERLKEHNLLDDKRYAINKVYTFKANFLSNNRIIFNLKKAGISDEIIDSIVLNNYDEELLQAKKLAEKYQNSINGKSLKQKKQLIINKLMYEGYKYEIAHNALSALDFSDEVLDEDDILKKEASKQIKKYSRKYKGTELRNKVYMALVSKGFAYDNIFAVINEMEL